LDHIPFEEIGMGSRGASPIFRPLNRRERWGLILLAALFVLFSLVVGHRSLLLSRHMTDLNAFLRGAWAVRTGENLYEVADENGFHYIYPPLLAILLTPFANPPAGVHAAWTVPFAVSVFLMYAFSIACAFWASHWLASALEQRSPDPQVRSQPAGCWRWWALRILPLLLVLPEILGTLGRGQVNLLLLALLCGTIGAILRKRSWLAGAFLSGAICLKVLPAFLLLYPLWRRDARCLVSCALGLIVGLAVIPALRGPEWAITQYQAMAGKVLFPGLGAGEDHTLATTLTNVTGTDSESLLSTLHNTLHLNRETRPNEASVTTRAIALLAGGLLTALTLWAAGWRRQRSTWVEMLFFGQLMLLMVLISPVCHLAYFVLEMPLIMAVIDTAWIPASPGKARLLAALFVGVFVAHILPHIPGLEVLRDLGFGMYAALLWWAVAWLMVSKDKRDMATGEWGREELRSAA
jgi:Glycosyltransferase family 87